MLKYEIRERRIDLEKKKKQRQRKTIIEINSVLWGGAQQRHHLF